MPDLVQIFPNSAEGKFAGWFKKSLIPWLHKRLLYRFKKQDVDKLETYNSQTLNSVVSIISIGVTSLAIYIAIGLLYTAHTHLLQLLTVFLFTAIVTICIAVFANERFTGAVATYVNSFFSPSSLFSLTLGRLAAVLVTLLANNENSKELSH